ncbi:hypothetical protein ON010_g12489 [Phytophthora cinnamomi]|nr:hypothetical protein ON010_g12489 [Phytophthora cinnamomi]
MQYTRRCLLTTEMEAFLGYFRAPWLGSYNVESCNVRGLENSLVARTNNHLHELNPSFPNPAPNVTSIVSVVRAISQGYSTKHANRAQGRRKRGNKRNAKKRKGARRHATSTDTDGMTSIDLPTPVMFIESDAVTGSESEVYMPTCDIPSDAYPEVAEESESDEEAAPDFSIEPGEYWADENQEAVA